MTLQRFFSSIELLANQTAPSLLRYGLFVFNYDLMGKEILQLIFHIVLIVSGLRLMSASVTVIYQMTILDRLVAAGFGCLFLGIAFCIPNVVFIRFADVPLRQNSGMEFILLCQTLVFLVFAFFILYLHARAIGTLFQNQREYRFVSALAYFAAFCFYWPGIYLFFAHDALHVDLWFDSPVTWLSISGALAIGINIFSEKNLKST